MTRTLRLKDLESAAANASEQPFFTTGSSGRNGVRGAVDAPPQAQGVIFQDNFDTQADWHSGLPENDKGGLKASGGTVDIVQKAETHNIPDGWSYVRQVPAWAPSMGHPEANEVIEILASNADKTRSGTGKSFVSWRDSDTTNGDMYWNSDGVLIKYFPEGYYEIYAEFWMTFSNDMIATYYNTDYKDESTGSGKLFRVYHWNPELNGPFEFFGGNSNPNFSWGFEGRPTSNNGYGFRNGLATLTRREGASEGHLLDANGHPTTSKSSSYRTDAILEGAAIPNQRDGGLIGTTGSVDIDMVFGNQAHWTKMAFYVKMNSAPGVFDGVLKQWIDDQLITNHTTMNWVESTRDMVPWTVVGLGGNDWFNKYPNEMRVNEWYAIDDLVVRDSIPDGLEV